MVVFGPHLHRRSQGVHWVHVHTQGGEKLWAKFTGKSCKCTPRQRVSIFRKLGKCYLGSFTVCFKGDD